MLTTLLQKGNDLGYFEFKDKGDKQGISMLALGIERYLQEREQYVMDRIIEAAKR